MSTNHHSSPLKRFWYGASIAEFLRSDSNAIYGALSKQSDFSDEVTQKHAWLTEIELLKDSLAGLEGDLFLEFGIPRMGSRIDAVVLSGSVVLVLEFKIGEDTFRSSAIEQVWDYALELKNFHEASHRASIVPILIVTEGRPRPLRAISQGRDDVYHPILIHSSELREAIDVIRNGISGQPVDHDAWPASSYRPTPTIVEAARALYNGHTVEDIMRKDAENLSITAGQVEKIVDQARTNRQKVVCFVTGVPGAGKTLIGLDIATRRSGTDKATHAVYLSGNEPLVRVLCEALTRDEMTRRRDSGHKARKGEIKAEVKLFIQNVHHFRDEALKDELPPDEHIAIFDEAQRAWNVEKTSSFMRKKKGLLNFNMSEPEFLISYMDRHKDWAAIICLVGGGQEIHDGEAGIGAWLSAIESRFPGWNIHISPRLTDSEYAYDQSAGVVRERQNTYLDSSLHLAVSMRSFRAENVSAFVKALLDCERQDAKSEFSLLAERYPIAITRDLCRAKQWIRERACGSERYGLLASSKAQRLKPHAIDVRVSVDPIHYFLNNKNDPRASFYLEDAATEFQVQGLELDWACVTWDGDLRFNGSGWEFYRFKGAKWENIKKPERRRYLCNAYRVLLTRARQGMVIFVPHGDREDATRRPKYYDATFEYLAELGIPQV